MVLQSKCAQDYSPGGGREPQQFQASNLIENSVFTKFNPSDVTETSKWHTKFSTRKIKHASFAIINFQAQYQSWILGVKLQRTQTKLSLPTTWEDQAKKQFRHVAFEETMLNCCSCRALAPFAFPTATVRCLKGWKGQQRSVLVKELAMLHLAVNKCVVVAKQNSASGPGEKNCCQGNLILNKWLTHPKGLSNLIKRSLNYINLQKEREA